MNQRKFSIIGAALIVIMVAGITDYFALHNKTDIALPQESQNQTIRSDDDKGGWKIYQNKQFDYTIKVPPNFKYLEIGEGKHVTFIEQGHDTVPSAPFVLLVTVNTTQSIEDEIEYLEERFAPGGKVIKTPIAVGNVSATQIIPQDCPIKGTSCGVFATVIPGAGAIYTIRGDILDVKQFDMYLEIYHHAVASFQLQKTGSNIVH